MRRTPVALISLVVSLGLAACSGDQGTTSPRGIAPSRTASADLALTCDANAFSTMSQDAKNYFASGDLVFAIISDMKTQFRTSRAAATPDGFDILARVADARRSGAEIGSAAAGGKFVLDVVGCMDVGNVPDKFTPAAALAGGVFEVRGNSESAAAALALNASPNTPATNPSTEWGAEPNALWARPVATAPYGRYLIYGYPVGGGVLTDGFELGTLPTAVSTSFASSDVGFRVGLCLSPAQGTTAANRLLHLGAIVTGTNTVDQGTLFCKPFLTTASLNSTTWFASFVKEVSVLLSPRALSAQEDGFYGIGGLPDGWSPFNFNQIAGSDIVLQYGQQPTNENVNTPIVPTVTVLATKGALPIPGVRIHISITGNNGAPDTIAGNDAVTGADGIASFPGLQLSKAGGYTLTASGSLSGVSTQFVISNLFNVKNQ